MRGLQYKTNKQKSYSEATKKMSRDKCYKHLSLESSENQRLQHKYPLHFLGHSLLSLDEQNEFLNPRCPGVQTDPLSTRQTSTEKIKNIYYIYVDFSLQLKSLGSVKSNE